MSSSAPQSICILGRQPALGLAELESLYGAETISVVSPQAAGLSLPADNVDFNRLGGSTRLAELFVEIPSKLWKDVEKAIAKALPEIVRPLPEGKIQLGLSCYSIPVTPAKLNATGLTLKKILRGKTGRSVRLTPNPELELNTAQVLHNHLTGPTGIELLIIATGSSTLIARTVAIQDIASYTLRDRGRPKRDARVGMLPPKLAQIIINLAVGKQKNHEPQITILDPFCGTGVVLQEAHIMGYSAYGTDIDPRMIEYTNQNLQWLSGLTEKHVQGATEVADATQHAWKEFPVSAVACETYLGRPFTEKPNAELLTQTVSEVNLIIKKFLQNIHQQLPKGTRFCLAVPAWQTSPNRFKHLPLIDQISNLGYTRVQFKHVDEKDLLYFREDQIVARQLLVLTK